jgi:hypothetical protein
MNYHFFHRYLRLDLSRAHDALMPREIVYHIDHAQARALYEFCDRRRLPSANLEDQLSIARKMRRGFRRDPAQDIETIDARTESAPRLIVAHLGFQGRNLCVSQVRWIGDY